MFFSKGVIENRHTVLLLEYHRRTLFHHSPREATLNQPTGIVALYCSQFFSENIKILLLIIFFRDLNP